MPPNVPPSCFICFVKVVETIQSIRVFWGLDAGMRKVGSEGVNTSNPKYLKKSMIDFWRQLNQV